MRSFYSLLILNEHFTKNVCHWKTRKIEEIWTEGNSHTRESFSSKMVFSYKQKSEYHPPSPKSTMMEGETNKIQYPENLDLQNNSNREFQLMYQHLEMNTLPFKWRN